MLTGADWCKWPNGYRGAGGGFPAQKAAVDAIDVSSSSSHPTKPSLFLLPCFARCPVDSLESVLSLTALSPHARSPTRSTGSAADRALRIESL